ncbi:glycosyltransferase family 4 protein [Leisingera sp. ANG-M7]|uniref:glycosyltransferase family 4 protein n=1 Tax=Leisingera sp. ANG-M7 TaxID=1577902 RepID=UPI00057F11D1|nr:glycosyltransferase family 4 protein [Leisingera sp. ANG-M7]KIC35676.1 hypothetical protein RA26_16655 [Leisingera sp. ANG-M7]
MADRLMDPDAPPGAPAPAMTILWVLLGRRDKASSRVRGYWVAEALKARGHSVQIRHTEHRLQYLSLLAAARQADAVIFQKKYGRYDLLAARLLRLLGKTVLFDIDDAPSRTQATATLQRANRMMALSCGVLAGSQALARLARQHQRAVHLLPSGILPANYRVKSHKPGKRLCLGWIGNGAHYADDLIRILQKPLQLTGARRPVTFRIVGACGVPELYRAFGSIEGVEIDFIDQIQWSDPGAVADAIAPFDIGLYPLLPHPFNEYKCAFKALEYMASGLPVVASRVGANTETVIDAQTGFLCQSADDWVQAIDTLAGDAELRSRFGANGRKRAGTHYDVARLAARLEDILRA